MFNTKVVLAVLIYMIAVDKFLIRSCLGSQIFILSSYVLRFISFLFFFEFFIQSRREIHPILKF